MFCKPEKCEFKWPKVEYLGVLVSEKVSLEFEISAIKLESGEE